eukprot:TRINITY_DN927_c0_g2_i1.p1 TRINITY_DN927_c0_g2~~TRINITY_DN927_c0_g2_i1.p1  ORF type:complete len:237 (+),score=41.66 TRINITY_DN927_c0_g2_i1:275-985(+)
MQERLPEHCADRNSCTDVVAIDVNMGCPKRFSVIGGMGAALLTQPEKVKDILTTLKRNLNLPITCKIRILETRQKTIDLLRLIENTGVSAVTIHARKTEERPHQPSHWEELKFITECGFSMPIIGNGDVYCQEDVERMKKETGVDSVMIARGAILNPSIFSKNDVDCYREDLMKRYLKIALETGNDFWNSKYVMMQMWKDLLSSTRDGDILTHSKSYSDLLPLFNASSHRLLKKPA